MDKTIGIRRFVAFGGAGGEESLLKAFAPPGQPYPWHFRLARRLFPPSLIRQKRAAKLRDFLHPLRCGRNFGPVNKYGSWMMFSDDVIGAITAVAADLDIEPAALLAVADVESGGQPYAIVRGKKEPLIRFEGHYFDRRLSGEKRERARKAGLASPAPGAIRNPFGQAARWRLLTRAEAIDREAARESVSWGLGQVVGAHWKMLGYANVDAFVSELRESVTGQARVMARFIAQAGLVDALKRHDWAAFARGYNGSLFARNSYDRRIAEAFVAYRGSADALAYSFAANEEPALLSAGSVGPAVTRLQQCLTERGYAVDADGIFGARTSAALCRFQAEHGLAADGIAGPATMASLSDAERSGNESTSES